MRAVGVLGGMGPAATLDLMAKIYAADQAPIEQDRVRLIVDCDPSVPDRNAAMRGTGASPGTKLAAMARGLVAAGAELLVIACNTAHAWIADIAEATDVPIVSMVEAACDDLAAIAPRATRIGLLAGQGCLDAEVYQRAFAARGWSAVLPRAQSQSAFMAALYRVKSGELGPAERVAFLASAREVEAAGAEAVIAGCTEVPLIIGRGDLAVPLIDATNALARRAVALARAPG